MKGKDGRGRSWGRPDQGLIGHCHKTDCTKGAKQSPANREEPERQRIHLTRHYGSSEGRGPNAAGPYRLGEDYVTENRQKQRRDESHMGLTPELRGRIRNAEPFPLNE